MNAINRRERISAPRLVNNGHDLAEGIAEADAEGSAIVHDLVLTQRMIDRLLVARRINEIEHQVATRLRDNYERAKLIVGRQSARDLGSPLGSSSDPPWIANEDEWRSYSSAMRQCGHWKQVLRFVVIDDRSPLEYGAKYHCEGLLSLKIAIERLGHHWGVDVRPKSE